MTENNKSDSKLKVNSANTKELIVIGVVSILVLYVGGLLFGEKKAKGD
tara:strand:+ start:306 stop:449 length:144 start_codon:yes stop_codon:yes gene_type:complete